MSVIVPICEISENFTNYIINKSLAVICLSKNSTRFNRKELTSNPLLKVSSPKKYLNILTTEAPYKIKVDLRNSKEGYYIATNEHPNLDLPLNMLLRKMP